MVRSLLSVRYLLSLTFLTPPLSEMQYLSVGRHNRPSLSDNLPKASVRVRAMRIVKLVLAFRPVSSANHWKVESTQKERMAECATRA